MPCAARTRRAPAKSPPPPVRTWPPSPWAAAWAPPAWPRPRSRCTCLQTETPSLLLPLPSPPLQPPPEGPCRLSQRGGDAACRSWVSMAMIRASSVHSCQCSWLMKTTSQRAVSRVWKASKQRPYTPPRQPRTAEIGAFVHACADGFRSTVKERPGSGGSEHEVFRGPGRCQRSSAHSRTHWTRRVHASPHVQRSGLRRPPTATRPECDCRSTGGCGTVMRMHANAWRQAGCV